DLGASARPDAMDESPLYRSFVEIDGRRVRLGLPPELLGGYGAPPTGNPAANPATEVPGPAPGDVTAPITGTLLAWKAGDGSTVQADEVIAVMEAMKMETEIIAPFAGVLRHQC